MVPILDVSLGKQLQPDFVRWDAYGLIGYTLPWSDEVQWTPYFVSIPKVGNPSCRRDGGVG